MQTENLSFRSLAARTVVVHTLTYIVVGAIAAAVLGYKDLFALPELSCFMRPIGDRWVMAGPLFQPLRGMLFASVFFILRERLFLQDRGWLAMWWILVAIGVFSTFGPAPASVEGLVYTRVPWPAQVRGLPEVLVQSLLLSSVLYVWVRNPNRRWLSWVLGAMFVLAMAMVTLGLLLPQQRPN